MRRTSFEDMACPVARATDILGDSWSMLILREVFYGHHRFDEFVTELGIASNTLTRRLGNWWNGSCSRSGSTATSRRAMSTC